VASCKAKSSDLMEILIIIKTIVYPPFPPGIGGLADFLLFFGFLAPYNF
jgi:hypothetical protein